MSNLIKKIISDSQPEKVNFLQMLGMVWFILMGIACTALVGIEYVVAFIQWRIPFSAYTQDEIGTCLRAIIAVATVASIIVAAVVTHMENK